MCFSLVPKKLVQESISRHPSFPSPPSVPHDPNVVGDSAPPDGTPSLTSDSAPGKKQTIMTEPKHNLQKIPTGISLIAFIRAMMGNTDLKS